MTDVLIVDDHSPFAQELARLLELAGCRVVGIAGDIAEAERLLHATPADLALVDVVLPGINGIEGIPRLRAIMPELPIILMSAHVDQADLFQNAAREAGNVRFIAKDDLDVNQIHAWAKRQQNHASPKGGK
ncbi:MAG: response regulator [Caldilineae bacterium]|nr:MAG: response regulator [Caldilineae bacterium]